MRIAALVVLALCATAAADAGKRPYLDSNPGLLRDLAGTPRIAIVGSATFVSKSTKEIEASDAGGFLATDATHARDTDAIAADKKAYWVAADLIEFEIGCGMAPCPPPPPPPPAKSHGTFLWQLGATDWELVAMAASPTVTGKEQAAAMKLGTKPPAIDKKIDAGAEDAVKLFEATLGDPKALAKSVSARKDVVLFGSEPAERTVGGAKVAAKLQGWNLALKVRDGIQAGTTSSKTVAWVTANVDATSLKKPKDKPVPYRLFVIYEKTGAEWKLVHANFAYIAPDA
jgi:hypothetical protein